MWTFVVVVVVNQRICPFENLVCMLFHCWHDPVLLLLICNASSMVEWTLGSHHYNHNFLVKLSVFTLCLCWNLLSYCTLQDIYVKMLMDTSSALMRKGITFYQDLLGFTSAWFFLSSKSLILYVCVQEQLWTWKWRCRGSQAVRCLWLVSDVFQLKCVGLKCRSCLVCACDVIPIFSVALF
jgi:hypothetical protein